MPKQLRNLTEQSLIHEHALAEVIGMRIRHRRRELGLTQADLRERMEGEHVMISRTQYSRIENGDSLPNAAEIIALHKVLHVPTDWILGILEL